MENEFKCRLLQRGSALFMQKTEHRYCGLCGARSASLDWWIGHVR